MHKMPKLRFRETAFDLAINEAKKSCMQHKHGSVIFNKSGQVIGAGHNFPWTLGNIWSCHAEMAALNSLSRRDRKTLSDCTLVVVRLGTPAPVVPLTSGMPGASGMPGTSLTTTMPHPHPRPQTQNQEPCLKMSMPCRRCAERIHKCNIKYCFYSVSGDAA